MAKLHEDYYLRKCLLDRNQVPSQSDMKNKMGPALANVYFKSMTPKLKMIAGLEPPLRGGGKDWYMPPMDLLGGRAVLKPIHRKFLSMLGFDGIVFFGEKFVENFGHRLEMEKQKLLSENDLKWQKTIETCCQEQWEVVAAEEEQRNTLKIKHDFEKFAATYRTSLSKIESLLSDASQKEIQRVRNEAHSVMGKNFKILQEKQSTLLHNRHEKKLKIEKRNIKKKFREDIEKAQIDFGNEVHDLNIQKHVAIEKLRTLLECQNLACQVYVALKERTECNKELDMSKRKYEKTIKKISDEIKMKDFKIKLAREKEKKQNEFNRMWQRKVCHVVKRFQEFVKYCLNAMPDHADFFINMEKLMLLQLSDALENPRAKSMFQSEDDTVETPVPHPFYLVYDESFKPQIDENLCPKHCTSSASQLPVIVVNKRCMYAACDNFDLFIDKVKQFLDGQRGNDDNFRDDHDYTYDVPIDFTSSDQLRQLQLESSLMQILQNTLPNVKSVPVECSICRSAYCFCSSEHQSKTNLQEVETTQSPKYVPSGDKITQRSDELKHMREPKIDSYLDFIRPKKCNCEKTAKKHLKEHLPAYMRNTSKFERVDIPHYEICGLDDLKRLVRNSRKVQPKVVPQKPETEVKNASTQYTDMEYDILCNCYSNEELQKIFKELSGDIKIQKEKTKPLSALAGHPSASYLEKQSSYFAIEEALALKQIIRESPDLEELFKKEDCASENFKLEL